MASRLCIFISVILMCISIAPEMHLKVIVWNVGQGQWLTFIDGDDCWHFDMGGEHAPWKSVMKMCRSGNNYVSLSHWDWDHISFISRARNFLPNICLLVPPSGRPSPRKAEMLRGLSSCHRRADFIYWTPELGRTANANSRVFWNRSLLIPGDSPRAQEKIWIHKLPAQALTTTRILILGHHGSRTSTSLELLRSLPQVKQAIASSRYRRYRHPHKEVERELREFKVPLLTTENWGTIEIELD
jgi:competence protein ComEC